MGTNFVKKMLSSKRLTTFLITCGETEQSTSAYRQLVNPSTRQLANSPPFVRFSAEILTLWLPFYPPNSNQAAKNRFSRRFVLRQKGVNMRCWQNEFLFKTTVICTRFGAICSKI